MTILMINILKFNYFMKKKMEGRFNVLGKLIIPKILLSLDYISSELEENEREENFRLKRFKQLKVKKQSEEVQICRCCFSTFAAGEVMDGNMCTICKNNVRLKAKVERRAPHVQCIKDGKLQLERACHLDSERIHLPNKEDKNEEYIHVKDEEILPLGDSLSVTYEEYEDGQIKEEESPRQQDKEKDESKEIIEYPEREEAIFLCSETQKTHMYSYILSVLSSVYDVKQDIDAYQLSPLHLRKLLRMPANLPYPYEGVDYYPKFLRMPKDIIPSFIDNCKKRTLQHKLRAEKLKMPSDLTPPSIPCVECKLLLDAKLHKSACELEDCEKCKSLLHMPLDLPILSCRNCSSKSHLIMPLDISIHLSPCHSVYKKCENISPIESFLPKPAPNSSYLPYELPRETSVCHSSTPKLKKLLRMPSNLPSEEDMRTRDEESPRLSGAFHYDEKDESKGIMEYPEHDSVAFLCSESQKTHMYSYILSVLSPVYDVKQDIDISEVSPLHLKKLLKMPANLPYPYEGIDYFPKFLRMPKDIMPSYRDNCKKFTSQHHPRGKKIRMPSDLAPSSIPCVECKSLLDKNIVHKSICDLKDCEKCKPLLHMPLDLPILSCRNCLSNSHFSMDLDIPINLSPCHSVYKTCENLSPVTSFSPKAAPNSSYLPFELPRETLVCHSWTPKLKKLLRMPKNLTSDSAQSEPTIESANTSRCSCQHTQSSNPKNQALHMYIHRLCQPQRNEGYIRMPLNLITENQACPHSDIIYITEDASTCSPCAITTSDEEKLFHDCSIDLKHCCDSTCSLNLKDFDKIVKVETKKKRRPDGTFREEKVVTEKYFVKSKIKPQNVCSKTPDVCHKSPNVCSKSSYICTNPSDICSKSQDICSCSRSDEIKDMLLGIWSCGHSKQDEDKANTPLDTETECIDCISKKFNGNKDDQKGVNSTDNIKLQIICRCNEDENEENQIKCACYKAAISENNDGENICTLRRLPDLVCCKNDECLTHKLMNLISPCQLGNKKVASDYNANHPCRSIVLKSADNEIVVCSKPNSKECLKKSGLDTSVQQKEVDIVPPCCRFFKSKDTTTGVPSASPISPIDPKMMTNLSMKWYDETSFAKTSAQLNQESTISKIVKSFLKKNNHKGTSCTDLEIVRECLKNSKELSKPHKSADLCDKMKHCRMKDCPFHSLPHQKGASSSKEEPTTSDTPYNKQSESFVPITPQNTEIIVSKEKPNSKPETNLSEKEELKDEYLKIKEEVDRITKLLSKNDSKAYYKTVGKQETNKSCCPIPSRLGLPITPTPIIPLSKSPLASNNYPSKYNTDDAKTKDAGTQTKVPICDREVNSCEECSKESATLSSHSIHKSKNKHSHDKFHDNHSNHHHHHYTKEKPCTACSEKIETLSSSEHKHHEDNCDRYHDHHYTKEKCVIKIKVKDAKRPLTENENFYIEGEMEDGSNVVIFRRSKSNISKDTKSNEFMEGICENCLAILRGEKRTHTPNCIHRLQAKKCKYCDLLADYSVSADPSVNVSTKDSDHQCCQTSTFSTKSSFLSSFSVPGEELCIKFSKSPSQSNKTRFTPCSSAPSGAEFKSCDQASKIRRYTSDCTIHKPITSCGTPRPCKSVCIVCPRTNDACTSTKVANRYDVRSICDEPRTRRRSRCTPKPSNSRCVTRSVQYLMKSDTALNRTKRRTRPLRSRSFYESDCKYFKTPCCGCPF